MNHATSPRGRPARWTDPELHRITQEGDDVSLLGALIEHYQRKYWCRVHQHPPSKGGLLPSI